MSYRLEATLRMVLYVLACAAVSWLLLSGGAE